MKIEKNSGDEFGNKVFVIIIIAILALGFFLQFGNFGNYIDNVDKQDTSGSATLITGQQGRGKDKESSPPPITGYPTGNNCDSGTYQGRCNGRSALRCIGGKEWAEKCKNGECFTYKDSNGNTQARCTGNCYKDCKNVCADPRKLYRCMPCDEKKKKYEGVNCPTGFHCEGGTCVANIRLPFP